jgi:alkylation response protein AidB-like acyl-CoA dehydrogenase
MGEEEHKLGIRASSTVRFSLTKTKVPVENMSERGNGFKIAMNAFECWSYQIGCSPLDAQRRVISTQLYMQTKESSLTPHSQFDIRSKLAEMALSCR